MYSVFDAAVGIVGPVAVVIFEQLILRIGEERTSLQCVFIGTERNLFASRSIEVVVGNFYVCFVGTDVVGIRAPLVGDSPNELGGIACIVETSVGGGSLVHIAFECTECAVGTLRPQAGELGIAIVVFYSHEGSLGIFVAERSGEFCLGNRLGVVDGEAARIRGTALDFGLAFPCESPSQFYAFARLDAFDFGIGGALIGIGNLGSGGSGVDSPHALVVVAQGGGVEFNIFAAIVISAGEVVLDVDGLVAVGDDSEIICSLLAGAACNDAVFYDVLPNFPLKFVNAAGDVET